MQTGQVANDISAYFWVVVRGLKPFNIARQTRSLTSTDRWVKPTLPSVSDVGPAKPRSGYGGSPYPNVTYPSRTVRTPSPGWLNGDHISPPSPAHVCPRTGAFPVSTIELWVLIPMVVDRRCLCLIGVPLFPMSLGCGRRPTIRHDLARSGSSADLEIKNTLAADQKHGWLNTDPCCRVICPLDDVAIRGALIQTEGQSTFERSMLLLLLLLLLISAFIANLFWKRIRALP